MPLRAFRYRLYPSRAQETLILDTLFLCSVLYNDLLEERRAKWKLQGVSVGFQEQCRSLPLRKAENPRLHSVYSQVLQDVAKRVDKAFDGFFRRLERGEKPGYPRFRPCRRYDSFTYPQAGSAFHLVEGGRRLHLAKIGDVKIKLHRELEGVPKTCTICRRAGRFYAVITCEVPLPTPLPRTGRAAGVDLGIESFAVTSDGEFFPPARYLRKSLQRIRRLQRGIARSKQGSARRRKRVRMLQRMHVRLADQRRDMHCKTAYRLAREYDLIAVEDLAIRNMVRNPHLALSIQDAAWGAFLKRLLGKAEEAGRSVERVDPRYTSQECSRCGRIEKKTLSQRWHSCPCGAQMHRDVNSALVILRRVLHKIA